METRKRRRFTAEYKSEAVKRQGDWVNGGSRGLSDEGLEVGGVPAGALAAVLEADGRRRLAQQVHRHASGHGHVGERVAGPEPGEVIAKDDVQVPVRPVLDPPVPADGAGEGGGVEPGGAQILTFRGYT